MLSSKIILPTPHLSHLASFMHGYSIKENSCLFDLFILPQIPSFCPLLTCDSHTYLNITNK